jgi:putative ABC transport system permease protein
MASAREEGVSTLTTLLASIAAVSVLVGGIGLMNIMLFSVTERTHEIGIRMAVGTRPRDILAQFLAAAMTLAIFGGILGIALGLLVASRLAQSFGWPVMIQPRIVGLAVSFSGLVGLAFGIYPAQKASHRRLEIRVAGFIT